MKRVFVLISLVVAILVIVGNVFAQDEISNIPEPSLDPEWKLVAKDSDGTTVYVNTKEITYLPEGIVKVRVLRVPRGELRRTILNVLKIVLLFKGDDTNNAERLWYGNYLYKFNCKNHQFASLGYINYSFEKAVLDDYSAQHEEWDDIVPGSVNEAVEKYVCNETPLSIPEPSLDPEWKFVDIALGYGTVYLNTRRINYLPKGIVEVWILTVLSGESREYYVNLLKKELTSKGRDPNNAERLWYVVILYKINCRTHQVATLEGVAYSFERTVLSSGSFKYEEWKRIIPGSLGADLEKYVCKKHKEKK